ncbi:hypothetical protein RHGRI_016167 [Rhododendron griersonianum]|uniref:TF-B3 domain-containing protein n=1 Tax=Rhododendron griersonianum TaxID=479676 RepID=A0AAV6JT44_9ERIC|nr:hypothetical protein RHGRI_016167 [Rhododendron griersonianum]
MFCFCRKMGEDCGDCSKWEQDMYWTHFQSIMFLQILSLGFDQQLAIPEKFARNMKKKLPENVTVVGPSGAQWDVGLVLSGETFLFKHGWKEFVKDHLLKEDDVLIFKYNGESRFDVIIFNGQSFCERESSYFVTKCGHTERDGGFRTKRNMGESPIEVECDSLDCGGECSPSKRPRNNENMKSAHLGRPTQSRRRVGVKKVNSVAKDGTVGGYPLQYVSNRRPVTEEEKKNALQMARAALTPSSCIVSIPSEWVLSHLPRKGKDVTLRVKKKEKTWHARYSGIVGSRARGLSGGWKDFAFDNNLEESDVCLFELSSGIHDDIVMDVSIFRVVTEDIPVKFARNMKRKLPENVTVIGPSGSNWNVGLVASGDTFLFKHGWKEFVEDHSLKEDDVLIFRYNGDSRFDVLIFNGRSFCERESSYFVRKCGHTELDPGFQTKRNMGESPVGVGHDSSDCGEGCTPSKRPRSNENLQSSCLRRRTQAKTRDGASDVMTHHGKRVVGQKVNLAAKEGLVGSYLLQYVSNRKPITEAEEENALKMARAASTPNSFMVVMRPTHVYRKFFMAIPSDWVRSRLPRKSQDVTLRVKENEKTWHAKYECRFGRGASGLVGGWKDFVFENNLEEFDVCLFELASGTHDRIVMDVSIFRVVAESIPSEWALSHLLHKNLDVILRVKEKENTWHANYYGGVGNSGGLVGGWKDFAVENNLEESDVCLFELTSGTHDGIVMDVTR